MKKWMVYAKRADFNRIGQKFQIDPVIARIIRNRDLVDTEQIRRFLHGGKDDLYDPLLLTDAEKAVRILVEKINQEKPIRIISDYDVDGVMAGYILLRALTHLGANVDYKIPDRVEDGYGINVRLLAEAAEDGIDTVLTCDNGIAASGQIAAGKQRGLTIIVTDHHEVPYEETAHGREYSIPGADAVIDPKRPDCAYPDQNLCGASVAWKLMLALYTMTGQDTAVVDELLPFAAIATICDVVDLIDENRIIAKYGLELLAKTTHIGLSALITVNGLPKDSLTAYHIGFILGPCINATGRLTSAELSMKLLQAQTPEEAFVLAEQLKGLNDRRKEMTARSVEEAVRLVNTYPVLPNVLVLYLPDCHESIAGIVAGRIREKYYRPTFVVTKGAEGLKGSGRSIEGYHMYEEISRCKDLLDKYGGHPMAAGFSLPEANLEPLRARLLENETLSADSLVETLHIDVPVPVHYLSERLIRQMELLGPFGKGNPKPLFAEKGLRIRSYRILGQNRNVCRLTLENQAGTVIQAVIFREIPDGLDHSSMIDCVYYPDLHEFQGNVSIQIVIQDYRLY